MTPDIFSGYSLHSAPYEIPDGVKILTIYYKRYYICLGYLYSRGGVIISGHLNCRCITLEGGYKYFRKCITWTLKFYKKHKPGILIYICRYSFSVILMHTIIACRCRENVPIRQFFINLLSI